MTRSLALLWLLVVLSLSAYVAGRVYNGLTFQTDLMALLPKEEQDPGAASANEAATNALSRRVLFLVGDRDASVARAVASNIAKRLETAGLVELSAGSMDKTQLQKMGAFYFPYRSGLLSDEDRELLKSKQGEAIAMRALSQTYSIAGFANAALLHVDPFLLMPNFMMNLPVPMSRAVLDDGFLSVQEEGITWVMLAGKLKGEPYALDVQKDLTGTLDNMLQTERSLHPDVQLLRLGAVFFAKAGAEQAMNETSTIGFVSVAGIVFLIALVFRGLRSLMLSLVVIGVGVVSGLAAGLFLFGGLHVGVLLFGVGLIGVSVDYSLQYCCEVFADSSAKATERLKRVFWGITLGMTMAVIGYMTLYLAPFPGLHQIAAFSAVGLIASWLTVILWVPFLDRDTKVSLQPIMAVGPDKLLEAWEKPEYRALRLRMIGLVVVFAAIGFSRLRVDDDVRRMQSLSPDLVTEQEKIQSYLGTTAGEQFLVVQAPNDERALHIEEVLADRLRPLVGSALNGFQTVAQYIPSMERQKENRTYQIEQLYKPLLSKQVARFGLHAFPKSPSGQEPMLDLAALRKEAKLPPFLSPLLLQSSDSEVVHMVSLDAVAQSDTIATAAEKILGVHKIDLAKDFSTLLGKYRNRAMTLLAVSALLMAPVLVGRYGFRGAMKVMFAPALAVALTPGIRALTGASFTFFDAMALVLVLAIGMDYAVFCAETSEKRKSVTMFAVVLSACTTLLSFGLLTLSGVSAVAHFGATMAVGVTFSLLFAPIALMSRRLCKVGSLKAVVPLVLVLLLGACSTSGVDSPISESAMPAKAPIAPNVQMEVPSPALMGRTLEVTQLVTVHYGERTFAFEAYINASPEKFYMIGLDMMGRKLFTIDWTNERIAYQKADWVPAELKPENILADIVLLYWPKSAIEKSLLKSGAHLGASRDARAVYVDKQRVWDATYQSTEKGNPWSGQLTYRSIAWGYDFNVQSLEAP